MGTAHFAGNSMGGALALELAKRGRARSVVAISPGGGWAEYDAREVERIIRLFKRNQKSARATERHHERLSAGRGFRRIGMRDIMTRGHLMPAERPCCWRDPPRAAPSSRTCSRRCATARAGSSTSTRSGAPTLVAWGEKDRLLPMDRHARALPHGDPRRASSACCAGLGHTPMWDDPAQIAELIADFATAAAAGNGQAASVHGARPAGSAG